ncbi:MAG TPA: substrate-binding domain-containing protein [Phnomibacter sp.]|nr:substrate-binding domain-containing protein [Phnomibacter sp.]
MINKKPYKDFATWRLLLLCLIGMMVACSTSPNADADDELDDTPSKGTIRISVDESFKPVIDSQIKVYMASYPKTTIIAEYKPEAECLKDLDDDSIRLVIVTRGLTKPESDYYREKIGFMPAWGNLAYDAVALVCNKQAKDSIFTVGDIRDMLAGTSGYKYKIIMDGLKATSTVRYALDSILRGKPMEGKVEAARSSPEVIDAVAKDPNALGMLGVSWVGNTDDSAQLSFLNKVNMVSLQCTICPEPAYTKPYQANIQLGRYPLRRELMYILKENYTGLGRGFINFMVGERGQLIFKRAYLLPGRLSFNVRKMAIKE